MVALHRMRVYNTWEGGTKASPEPESFSVRQRNFQEVPSCLFLIFATVYSSSLVFPSLPFIFSSSLMTVSLLIRLQAVLLRTPTDTALRWASEPEFFQYACRYVPFRHFMPFFQTFPAFSYGASPQCPHFPNGVLKFPWFSKLAIHFFATSSSASLLIPLQTVWLRTPTDAAIELQTVLLRTPTDAALRWASDPWFFEYACLYVPSFFKALSCLHCMTFFKPFPTFLRFFQRFLPAISSFSQRFPRFPWFPWFFQACHSIFPAIFNDVPSFSLVFAYLFPTVFKGPRGNRTPPSPNCIVVHAPPKKSICTA